MINLARLSEENELPLFQHFRSTKTSYKSVNDWGKVISANILLGENMFVARTGFLVWQTLSSFSTFEAGPCGFELCSHHIKV